MKSRHIMLALVISGASLVTLRVLALSPAPKEDPGGAAVAFTRMENKKADILKRLGMSAPLELPEAGEEDFVAIAQEQGWIVEATLEEVEAALRAAKATPSTEDDIAAMRLAHRGSYRFYSEGIVPARKSSFSR